MQTILVIDYCYRAVSNKVSLALLPFYGLLFVPHLNSNHYWFTHQRYLVVTGAPTSEAGGWRKSP
jgi:hypothetical protein